MKSGDPRGTTHIGACFSADGICPPLAGVQGVAVPRQRGTV